MIKPGTKTGSVLLIVLIVVAMLALGGYGFARLMNVEALAAKTSGRSTQAKHAALSGVHFAAAFLLDQKINGVLGIDSYDAPELFHGQVVYEDPEDSTNRLVFSIIAAAPDDPNLTYYRHGLSDEAGRIHLNVLAAQSGESTDDQSSGTQQSSSSQQSSSLEGIPLEYNNPLMALPGMTPEIADAILDWIDQDDNKREYGAEFESYTQDPPYMPKNRPLESLDELLMVQGVTPRLLYGEDANRNGVLDPNEDDGETSYPYDNADGVLDRGWISYLTLHSRETNTDSMGAPRINLNNPDLQALYDQLVADPNFTDEEAKFIIAYRLFGAGGGESSSPPDDGNSDPDGQSGQGGGAQGGEGGGRGEPEEDPPAEEEEPEQPAEIAGLDASGGPKQEIESVVDLFGATVEAKIPNEEETEEIESPYKDENIADDLEKLLDLTTTAEEEDFQGLLNVNTASFEAFMSLPGMTEEVADDAILMQPDRTSDEISPTTAAWLVEKEILTKEQFKSFQRYLTGRSQVYRVQSVGFFELGGPVARLEAVIDLTGPSPRIRSLEDLSPLGRGFDPIELSRTIGL